MYGGVFIFAGGLGEVKGEGTQILYVNVYRVAPPPGEGGYYNSPPFTVLNCSITVPTFSSAVRCFELYAVGMFLLHARNLGYLFFAYTPPE